MCENSLQDWKSEGKEEGEFAQVLYFLLHLQYLTPEFSAECLYGRLSVAK